MLWVTILVHCCRSGPSALGPLLPGDKVRAVRLQRAGGAAVLSLHRAICEHFFCWHGRPQQLRGALGACPRLKARPHV